MSFKRIFSKFIKIGIIIIFGVVILNLIISLLQYLSSIANEQSLVFRLTEIDFITFLTTSFVCLIVSITLTNAINVVLIIFDVDEQIGKFVLNYLFKIFSAASIVIPMLLALTSEQFEVATAFISFIALFSFAFPKEFADQLVARSKNKEK